MKDLNIFSSKIFFFLLILLKVARKSINNCICFAQVVVNLKMVVGQLLCLPNLTKTKIFCVHKMTKVVVIGEDKDLIFAAF